MRIRAIGHTFFLKILLLLFVSIAMTRVLYMTFNGRHHEKELTTEFIPDGYPIFKLAFNPSGTRLAIGTWYGNAVFYDLIASIMLKVRFEGNAPVTALTFSSDGEMIAIGYADGTASIYRAAEEMIPVVVKLRLDVQIRKLTISPDNKYLIALGSSSLTIWKIHTDDVEMTYKGDSCHDFALAEAGSLIISIHFDGIVSIQKINNGIIMGHEFDLIADYRGVSVSEQRKIVALSDETKTDIYKVENIKLKKLSTIVSPTDFATVSPNGKSLAIADYFGTVSVWDIPSGKKILSLRCHTDRINAISFSPDSLTFATGSQDQRVRLWNIQVDRE